MVTIRELSREDLPRLEGLFSKGANGSFFHTSRWIGVWMKYFGTDIKLLGFFDGVNPVAFFGIKQLKNSLYLIPTAPVEINQRVSDFGSIPVLTGYEDEVGSVILKYITRKFSGYTFYLDFIADDDSTGQILSHLSFKKEQQDVSPFLTLPPSWDAYLTNLSRKDRHELRRKIKRLEASGTIEYIHSTDASHADEFFRLLSLSNYEKEKFLTKSMKAFFLSVMEEYEKDKTLTISLLCLNLIPIAATMGFVYRNEFLLYNSGFDPAYLSLSPGLVLIAQTVRRAIENKLTRFDFLRGNERYKYDLGATDRILYGYTRQV